MELRTLVPRIIKLGVNMGNYQFVTDVPFILGALVINRQLPNQPSQVVNPASFTFCAIGEPDEDGNVTENSLGVPGEVIAERVFNADIRNLPLQLPPADYRTFFQQPGRYKIVPDESGVQSYQCFALVFTY